MSEGWLAILVFTLLAFLLAGTVLTVKIILLSREVRRERVRGRTLVRRVKEIETGIDDVAKTLAEHLNYHQQQRN